MLELLAERLADARAEMPRFVTEEAPEEIGPAETAVVLVGHGSTDPAVNAEVHRVSRLFWETHAGDLLTVETAYVSHSRPGVPGGLERCRRLGAKRVIVLPYVLFAGAVLERIWAQALAYGANHEGLDIRCAEVIGDCEGLADVVIDRYEEALAGVGLPSADRRNAFDEIDTVPDTEIDTKLDREIDTEIGAGADSELDREIETEIETEIGSEPMPRPGVPSAV